MTILVIEFKKIENDDERKHSTFYLNSKAEIINESDIDNIFESIYITIVSNIQMFLGKVCGLIIDSVIDHVINL